MARINNGFNLPQFQGTQARATTLPSTNSSSSFKVHQSPPNSTGGGDFLRKLFRNIFIAHLFLITVLVITLSVRGLLAADRHRSFRPLKWYPPLLCSTGVAVIVSLTWQFSTLINPSRAIRAAFWLGPLMTCAAGILFVLIGTAGSMAAGGIALFSSVLQSLYCCWVSPRFHHAIKILSVSISPVPAKDPVTTILTLAAATLYTCLILAGIGGATKAATGNFLDSIFILLLLLSLAWTMQVIRNTSQVAISRVKYTNLTFGTGVNTGVALRDAASGSLGSVALGSAIGPVIGLIRGSARTVNLVSGDTDEFMFSCASCYLGVASRLVLCGNRWGFVHVGVYDKGFVQASTDTWEAFLGAGLEPLIDSDITSSLCFLAGIASGGAAAVSGGVWSLVVHNGYATQVSLYAFFIGYFMCRVAMAWPQACVSAYHVAYAENPQNPRFDSTIPTRIQELQRLSNREPREPRTTHLTEF